MRGKERQSPDRRGGGRITPAHAGKSRRLHALSLCEQDHPRPCGEKKKSMWSAMLEQGSPPPMRGKDRRYMVGYARTRITPAHAGKSTQQLYCPQGKVYHPRPCGEKQSPTFFLIGFSGSPPPMRGKALRRASLPTARRITPAHAGKSSDKSCPLYG